MAEALDANVVLRHCTGQPPAIATRATTALLKAAPRSLVLADLTVAEIVYGPHAMERTTAGSDAPA